MPLNILINFWQLSSLIMHMCVMNTFIFLHDDWSDFSVFLQECLTVL